MSAVTPEHNANFSLASLSDYLLEEVFSHLPQPDRLNMCLVNRRFYQVALKLVYRRIYLNDSNVVRSDFMNLAINWTLLSLPPLLSEEESRSLANDKLKKLIATLQSNNQATRCVTWIRINWDLAPSIQKTILEILCNEGSALQRLENVIDPSCNDIIATGKISSGSLTSFDMAPPNAMPEREAPPDYIPNLQKFITRRLSSRITYMNLFMDPLLLFNYITPLHQKLQVADLKLHWRCEFYPQHYFTTPVTEKVRTRLSDIFDIRTLKVLTIISWHESLMSKEKEILRQFEEFKNVEDISLISIKQDTLVLMRLFSSLSQIKRLKIDFVGESLFPSARPELFLTIVHSCKDLEFLDMRFEGLDVPIISIENGLFKIAQQCHCEACTHLFESVLNEKIFLFPEDFIIHDLQDIVTKDIFSMMRLYSLLPYSKACDSYPSVRTHPMDMGSFVSIVNERLFMYRSQMSQLTRPSVLFEMQNGDCEDLDELEMPHSAISRTDIVNYYHAVIHHYRRTYVALLHQFPKLRFLIINDIPTVVTEEDGDRVLHPVFYNEGFKSNLGTACQKSGNSRDDKVLAMKSAQRKGCRRAA
ncbi:LAMI_0G13630g1_1 [Lachancea mirantina]|uniref:LAMI_0G13630g1_1 n=1 Tax=Lachancea mirantina TaxID=1230905 RepID=A0A1G4KBT8_9SACH|nr:LAMI_0G13630g1_1 [Lachancea mirantina]